MKVSTAPDAPASIRQPAAPAPPWALILDCQLTRRKRCHAVQAPNGEIVFQSRIAWDCIEFLDAEGAESYIAVAGAITGGEEVHAVRCRKETSLWPS